MDAYLCSTEIIDWQHPDILALARQLAANEPLTTAKACFEWVRDEVRHSYDFHLNTITCRASDVLHARTGFCYAKSHLLAALLRANEFPTGLCYQRFREDDGTYFLHGLNAIHLPDFGWYRIDARGNKPSVNAQFVPPVEQLAFTLDADAGEVNLPDIYSDPLPVVVTALSTYTTCDQLCAHLPDFDPTPADSSSSYQRGFH
jgi:transglutaminase-like putative cysteine protease